LRPTSGEVHPHTMPFLSVFRRPACLALAAVLALALPLIPAPAEKVARAVPPGEVLPQERGSTGLQLMLRRLGTTARLMQTVAHPDDEDGGMLTLESRGRGDTVLLLTLNRGEGGQNKLGSNLFDVLGVLRTLELLASDRYYGVEQRFTRVADFGYSKNAEETFAKWGGHDVALGDMVRVIRTFRPDVLVARFSGTERDGHGHHQASAILTREAFRAAADPARFPEQLHEGLVPWQAKKVYTGIVCGFGVQVCPEATVKLNTGVADPLLGMSYIQFAMEGLRHQLSQGAGAWTVEPGDRFTFYKLADSVVPKAEEQGVQRDDFFDGIDTTLPGLASRLGDEEEKVSWLRPELVKLQGLVAQAKSAAGSNPRNAATPLLEGLAVVDGLIARVRKSQPGLSPSSEAYLLVNLETKRQQFQQAANLALGLTLNVAVDKPVGSSAEDAFMAVPGQSFPVRVRLVNGSGTNLAVREVRLDLPAGWHAVSSASKAGTVAAGQTLEASFRVTVPEDAECTKPYWHRTDPEKESVNTIDDSRYVTLPFPPPPLQAHVDYGFNQLGGSIGAVGTVAFKDTQGHEQRRSLAVAPAFSVALEPSSQVIPVGPDGARSIRVAVKNGLPSVEGADLQVAAPRGWRIEPASQKANFTKTGEVKEFEFKEYPAAQTEERSEVKASVEYRNRKYAEGYTVVTRDDLDTFYYYQPAVQRVSVVDVKVPRDLKVGYIMGAGDDIPGVLRQVGIDVTLIPAEKLATEDLSKYRTVVLGIRAYDTQKEVGENNRKLLDFDSAGGTLVVQYETSPADFNAGHYTPYPANLSRARVSVEEAPVEILAPQDRVFHFPNEITARDFEGWVQERGLYFMGSWDEKYTPLLASHDPGEAPQKGGLLRASYGKGMYIYTGYAFFRQLPAGVPGAVRLYVNLLSAGDSR
jgi:LmbE family N-acetylglucosaminyl deacetylase